MFFWLFWLLLCICGTSRVHAIQVYNISLGKCLPITQATPAPSYYNVYYSFPLMSDLLEANSLQPLVQNGNAVFSTGNNCSPFVSCWDANNGDLSFPPFFLPVQSSYSFMMWIKTDQNSSLLSTLYSSSVYTVVTSVGLLPNGQGIEIVFYQGNTNEYALKILTNVTFNNNFLHLGFTFNGTLDLASVYLNGSLVGSSYFLPTWTAANFLSYGYLEPTTSSFYGNLFCLLMWVETALDASDIQSIFLSQNINLRCSLPAYFPPSIYAIPRSSSSSSSSTGLFSSSSSTGSNINITTLPLFAKYMMNNFGNDIVLFYAMNDPLTALTLQDYSFRNNPGFFNPPQRYYNLQLPSLVYQNNGSIGFSGTQDNFIYSSFRQNITSYWSAQIWFSTTTSQGGGFFSWENNQPVVWMLNNGAIVFGCTDVVTTSDSGWNNGEIYLLTATSSSKNGLNLYINVVNEAGSSSTSCSGNPTSWIVGLFNFFLTNFPFSKPNSTNLQAILSDFIVYDIELSVSQIENIYLAGKNLGSIYNSLITTSTPFVPNNGDPGYVTVTILSPLNLPLSGYGVYLQGFDGIVASYSPSAGTTDSNGQAVFAITCNVNTGPCEMSEETTITITAYSSDFVTGIEINSSVAMTFYYASSFTATPMNQNVGGGPIDVVALIVDVNNNVQEGVLLTIGALQDTSELQIYPTVNQTTNSEGQVTWEITSNFVSSYNLTVYDQTHQQFLLSKVSINFIP
jgi:hypothetical protein